jgi:hypothetical protein
MSARASTLEEVSNSLKKYQLDAYDGGGNSIFLSILPGRSNAGSKISSRFVAMMILIFFVGSNPSN